MNVQAISPCDIFRWPCGTTCYRCEADHYALLGAEYEVVPVGSPEYQQLTQAQPCAQVCTAGPAQARHAVRGGEFMSRWHVPTGPDSLDTRRPVLAPGARIWRVGNGLMLHGAAPTCPNTKRQCANWRACYENGCTL